MRYFGTLGPNSHAVKTLTELFRAGMTGMRLNLSHGHLADHQDWIDSLVKAANKTRRTRYELLVDLNGPELRIGEVDGQVLLSPGQKIIIGKGGLAVPQEVFQVLKGADYVLMDDGRLRLLCVEVTEERACLEVQRGGYLSSHKSMAIEGKSVDLPTLNAKDIANIEVMKKYPVTGVMLPFVRGQADLYTLRQTLEHYDLKHVRIFAKIENMQGVRALPDLIDACDEVVIARGDLGNVMPVWELPAVQKEIAALCRQKQKPFMVVTQLLDSMIDHPTPTRAEISDIFNAVLDGADSLMVTGETAVGRYPDLVMRYLVNTGKYALQWKNKQKI